MNLPDAVIFHTGQHKGYNFRRGDGYTIRRIYDQSGTYIYTYGLKDYWYGFNRVVDAKYLRDHPNDWRPFGSK